MNLFKTVLGATLLALGFAVTSNIAIAKQLQNAQYLATNKILNGKRIFVCNQGDKVVIKKLRLL